MKTKLEQIETARELITFITAFGTPTDTESICRMQDIIGHTSFEELTELAKDDGTESADGHTWSTGRHGTQKETMSLLFTIWHWEDATRFYNTYVSKEYKSVIEKAGKSLELEAQREELKREAEAKQIALDKVNARADKAEQELREAQAEILKLKAMLFDFMTKTA